MPVSDALRSFIASADHGARPPLDVHPWWGRRHHDIMRGILVSALASPVADFTALATGAAAFPGTVVLDPFAGSGTAVIEALRLGCRPIGIDLNPVAWWIMRNRLLRVDLAALDAAAQGIHDELAARTAPLYSTRCPACKGDVPAATCFWAWSYICPSCRGTTVGLPSTRILSRNRQALTLCPACGASTSDGSASCPACGVAVSPDAGTVSRGVLTCVHCGSRHDLSAVLSGRQRRLVAVDADCSACGPRLKPAAPEEHQRAADAEAWLSGERGALSLPWLDAHPLSDWLGRQGHRTFDDLFLARQRVSLGMLLAAIQGIADDAVHDTLLTLFSDLLDYHMTATAVDNHGRLVRGYRQAGLALQPVTAEANPWSPAGPGSWLARYWSHCRSAKEQLLSDPKARVAGRDSGWPPVRFAASAHDLEPDGVLLHCGSGSAMPLRSGSVDLAVTSPPFFDALHYADLADLRHVWLRQALAERHAGFRPPVTPKGEEIVVQRTRATSKEQQLDLYMKNLEGAFREIARVLKPDGSLVYIFELPSLATFMHALQWTLGAGFYIADICALEFGAPAFRQSVRMRSFAITGIFYCYKRGGARPVRWKAFQDDFCFHVGAVLRARPTSTQEQTIELLWGEFVKRFSRAYPHVIADDGTAVSVGEAVDWVYALSSVTPAAGTSLAALAEAQALRKQLDGRDPSDADFATATDAIARKLAHEVSPDQAAEIRAWFRQAYGEALWDKLEPETREFLVGAEFLYRQCAGQDIDFGAVAVSFTKPLENELRKKFAPRLAAYAATRKIDVPPKAGTQKLDWRKLADGDVTLGNIEKLLSALDLPENAPVAEYLGSRAAGTGTYARERLPRVLKQFRENGRNAGAHIEPVEAAVVKGFREVLLATDEHVMHWVEL